MYRELIKSVIKEIVMQPESDPMDIIKGRLVGLHINDSLENLEALMIDELRRLHEGTLARYGLRVSQFKVWQAHPCGLNEAILGFPP